MKAGIWMGVMAGEVAAAENKSSLTPLTPVMDYLRRACERYIDLKPLLNLLYELEPRATQTGYSF